MATYYALTTINAQTNGWSIIADGTDKQQVLQSAEARIGPPSRDIYADTERKNLHVVSKTTARRKFHVGDEDFYDYLDTLADATEI